MREEGDNQVIKCSADADCDIAKSACCITSSKPIGGGEYTELLVLLLHHCFRDVHNQGRRNGFVIGGQKKILRGEAAQNFFELHFHIERI